MSIAKLYLILAAVGTVLPYGAFLPWLIEHGLNIHLFVLEAFVNPISTFAWLDVVVAACVLLVFIVVDGTRYRVQNAWVAVVGTLTVGVSCGLPLYLYLKSRREASERRNVNQ